MEGVHSSVARPHQACPTSTKGLGLSQGHSRTAIIELKLVKSEAVAEIDGAARVSSAHGFALANQIIVGSLQAGASIGDATLTQSIVGEHARKEKVVRVVAQIAVHVLGPHRK